MINLIFQIENTTHLANETFQMINISKELTLMSLFLSVVQKKINLE